MWNLIKKFRSIPEEKKIIVYGKLAFFKNLFYFLFKILVGVYFRSWFLIAIAIYSLFIGYVKNNCSSGLRKNKENIKDIHAYIRGGVVLAISSVFYIVYSVFSIYYPSNFEYNMIIAIAIAAFATYSIAMSIVGVCKTRGKTMLIKEYKLTNFATAFNNLVLAQIALLSFTATENAAFYNGLIGICVGVIIFGIGLYLMIDGLVKKHRYYQIIKDYPEIKKYIDN
ncbi:MAG TPA: hypothetical protein IAB72_02845 [Candidatus Onthoplasma faecipullorum]|nr:hypothetical protein [Candidatus Onthoplasma faecipullorum]